jgi:ribokinase
MNQIVVIGSSNTDMVVKTARFPRPGETLLGGEFFMFPGGKGANQAVAAARLDGQITCISKVGNDLFGRQALEGFKKENIDVRYILPDESTASGVALITVNADGQNTIVVAPGANNYLTAEDMIRFIPAFLAADIILMQLEIPMKTVEQAITIAGEMDKKIILNPAPAQAISFEMLEKLYLITPNETEAELLTGIAVKDLSSAGKAASSLLDSGVQNVIITLGAQGAFFKSPTHQFMIPSPVVVPVDTTAAGDVFNGAVAVALSEGLDWRAAITFACRAASLSVTRMGAQSSAPYRNELL